MLKDYLSTHSWKTTSAGLLAVIGGITQLVFSIKEKKFTQESVTIAATATLTGLGLLFARDNNKTSDDVGAVTKDSTIQNK